jgi:hypothetical protein
LYNISIIFNINNIAHIFIIIHPCIQRHFLIAFFFFQANKCVIVTERWLGSLLGILPQLIVHSTEEMVLARLAELNLDVTKTSTPSCDPLNVSRPQYTFTPETVLTR